MVRPVQDRAIVDAGLKALAFDSGPLLVPDRPAASYERASDEHGRFGVSYPPELRLTRQKGCIGDRSRIADIVVG